jgi:phosphatidylglycerophosphate synthase
VRTVQPGPLIGLIGQLGLLAVLSAAVGLGAVGGLVGAGYGLGLTMLLSRGLRRAGAGRLGPADRVTLARAVLVGAVMALVADQALTNVRVVTVVTLAACALALDGVDGWVARRTGTVSALGARFDMEVDAFLILVLSLPVARSVGLWVLSIGAARYLFVLGGWGLPWMRATLPARYWRKPVAAIQGIGLTLAVAGFLPRLGTVVVLAAALGLLAESFGRDVWWLWRRAHPHPEEAAAAAVRAGRSAG